MSKREAATKIVYDARGRIGDDDIWVVDLVESLLADEDDELEAAIEAGWSCREDFESDAFGEERLRRIIRARRRR